MVKLCKMIENIEILNYLQQNIKEINLHQEPNYLSTKFISKDLLVMEMKKTEVKINKPIYLGQAVSDLSKTLMFEFWYDYLKPI